MKRIPRFLKLPRSVERIRSDVDDEIAFDIDMRARDLVEQGVTAEHAREQAIREFGDIGGTKDYCEGVDMIIESQARRVGFLEDFRSDIAVAWRAMRRTPVFAAVVLLTLALGIGVNTAVFSVVRRVLIAPLPFRSPDELYRLYTIASTIDGDHDKLSAVELNDLAAQSKSVGAMTVFGNYGGLTYSDDKRAEAWSSASVSPSFFDVLGIRLRLGRPFSVEDTFNGANQKIIITYRVWQRVFGGDETIVGKTVQLNAIPFTVVGVLPESFVGPTFERDMLLPLNFDNVLRNPRLARSRIWRSIVRLRPGVSAQQFDAEIATLRPRLETSFPDIKHAGAIIATPLHAAMVGGAADVLVMIMSGALIVLVVTCVNIAGLFLSRAAAQRREMGVRTALGASRERLIRQVLTESLMYGVAGGVAGLLLAVVVKNALVREVSTMLPQLGDIRIDGGVLAFGAVIAIGAGVAFGLMPAFATTRLDARDALSDAAGRTASRGKAGARSSRVLVAIQIAFAVVLVVSAGLLTKTFIGLVRADLGYGTSDRQVTFSLNLQSRLRYPSERSAFVSAMSRRMHQIPGVAAIGYTVEGPWFGGWQHIGLRPEGRDDASATQLEYATASEEFFSAAEIAIRQGRVFGSGDRLGTPPVVVISETVARRLWPNGNAIGARVRLETGSADSIVPREVVGIVADVRQGATSAPMPTIYVPGEQAQIIGQEFVVRTTGDGEALIPAIQDVVRSLDSQLPIPNPRTLENVLSNSVKREQLAMALMALFAGLSLILATLGVYGIMAYTVLARTREFGIRAALGASRRAILLLVLQHGLATAVSGVAAGLVMAALLSRLIGSMLVGVSTHDLATFVMAPLILVVGAFIACLLPARAATRVDPIEVLRAD
jgi:putative ABC transport system permease protein